MAHTHSERTLDGNVLDSPRRLEEGEGVVVAAEQNELLHPAGTIDLSSQVSVASFGTASKAAKSGNSSSTEDPCGHTHYSGRANWLRAVVLGASDGLVTVGALMTGIGAAELSQHALLLSATAALVSGALSMAVGEFVSVASQRDVERADVEKERQAQETEESRAVELRELAAIYRSRGCTAETALEVAKQLSAHDAVAFAFGAAIPTLAMLFPTHLSRFWCNIGFTTAGLVFFGVLGAKLGHFNVLKGTFRVITGGWIALAVTFGIGRAFGTDVA